MWSTMPIEEMFLEVIQKVIADEPHMANLSHNEFAKFLMNRIGVEVDSFDLGRWFKEKEEKASPVVLIPNHSPITMPSSCICYDVCAQMLHVLMNRASPSLRYNSSPSSTTTISNRYHLAILSSLCNNINTLSSNLLTLTEGGM